MFINKSIQTAHQNQFETTEINEKKYQIAIKRMSLTQDKEIMQTRNSKTLLRSTQPIYQSENFIIFDHGDNHDDEKQEQQYKKQRGAIILPVGQPKSTKHKLIKKSKNGPQTQNNKKFVAKGNVISNLKRLDNLRYIVVIQKLEPILEETFLNLLKYAYLIMQKYFTHADANCKFSNKNCQAIHYKYKKKWSNIPSIISKIIKEHAFKKEQIKREREIFQSILPQFKYARDHYSSEKGPDYNEEIADQFFMELQKECKHRTTFRQEMYWNRSDYLKYVGFLNLYGKVPQQHKAEFKNLCVKNIFLNQEKFENKTQTLLDNSGRTIQEAKYHLIDQFKFTKDEILKESQSIELVIQKVKKQQEAQILKPSSFQQFKATIPLSLAQGELQIQIDGVRLTPKSHGFIVLKSSRLQVSGNSKINLKKSSMINLLCRAFFSSTQQQSQEIKSKWGGLSKHINQDSIFKLYQDFENSTKDKKCSSQCQLIIQQKENCMFGRKEMQILEEKQQINPNQANFASESPERLNFCQPIIQKQQWVQSEANNVKVSSLEYIAQETFKKLDTREKKYCEFTPVQQISYFNQKQHNFQERFSFLNLGEIGPIKGDQQLQKDFDKNYEKFDLSEHREFKLSHKLLQYLHLLLSCKIMEYEMMNNAKTFNKNPQRGYWYYSQIVRFVASLIINYKAFNDMKCFNTTVMQVVSSFVQTKSQEQCEYFYKKYQSQNRIHQEVISQFRTKYLIDQKQLGQEVKRQIKKYFQESSKWQTFISTKSNYVYSIYPTKVQIENSLRQSPLKINLSAHQIKAQKPQNNLDDLSQQQVKKCLDFLRQILQSDTHTIKCFPQSLNYEKTAQYVFQTDQSSKKQIESIRKFYETLPKEIGLNEVKAKLVQIQKIYEISEEKQVKLHRNFVMYNCLNAKEFQFIYLKNLIRRF